MKTMHPWIPILTLAILIAIEGPSLAEGTKIEQAADRSVDVKTGVYSARIDAKGNLVDLTVQGAKAFTHTFGNPGKPPETPPTVTLAGQKVLVQSGDLRVEWTFGEETIIFRTEGYNFECTLDPSVKAAASPASAGPIDSYAGFSAAVVLANDLTIASQNPMHVQARRYLPHAYLRGVKPGTLVENELKLGAPASTDQMLGTVQIRPYRANGSPLPVDTKQNLLATPLPDSKPQVITLVQRNFGKLPRSLEYRVDVRGQGEGGKEVLSTKSAVTLPGLSAGEEIVSLPALPAGAYALAVSAWDGENKLRESKLSFTVGSAGPVPAAAAATAAPIPKEITPGDWPDRRPVSQIFVSQNQYRTPNNPDGFLSKEENTVTPEGKAAFRTNLLAFADRCIKVTKDMDSQGVIVWDIEGFQQPGMVYLGDPRLLPEYAPAMNEVADEFFKKFRDAGLRTGLTIRPNRVARIQGEAAIARWGKWGYVLYDDQKDDVVKEISERITYAQKRWGCTLFYMDTNNYITTENGKKKKVTIPATMLKQLHELHPDVLILPEHPTPGGLEWSGQYAELRGGSRGTPEEDRAKYPGALTVLSLGGASKDAMLKNWDAVAANVARGDALFMAGWYPSGENRLIKEWYREAAWLRQPAKIPADASVADLLALAQKDDPATRFFAVKALGSKADASFAPALAALLETEKDWLVRKEIINALGAVKSDVAVSALVAELKKGAFGDSFFAREQLRKFGEAAALPVALDLAQSQTRQNRVDAAGLLAPIITKPAMEALRKLAQDPDQDVRSYAAACLKGRLGL